MKYLALAIIWLIPTVLQAQNDPFEDDAFKVFMDSAGKEYFPKGKASYYTKYLSAMKEPSLQRKLEDGTQWVFRFTYLRSFNDPISVRVTQKGNIFSARAVRLKMDSKYQVEKIAGDKSFTIEPEKLDMIQTQLKNKGFWKPLNNEELLLAGLDGSRWIFESHDKDGYRMIDIWSPGDLPPEDALKHAGIDSTALRDFLSYRQTGIKILKQSGVLLKAENLY